ncbi:hypothetical protein V6N11_030086 [Hibiscus sabdariffa]|uniref:Neprosin PEP catalytic domain-containing protein n=1 Tax=Hibiscus sabdariffa TaxID=183260 RepID=A0ABR2PK10_9ROSI
METKTLEAELLQDWQCPQGTIPIVSRPGQKTTPISPSNQLDANDAKIHDFALVSVSEGNYFGASARFNLWKPATFNGEFSLAQIWIVAGHGQETNSLKAGWRTYPETNYTHLFISWTSDGDQKTGCYDLECPGFVQISNKFGPGSILTPLSQYAGDQFEMSTYIYKDKKSGNWWLRVNEIDLGYWPSSLFTKLSDRAEIIMWGGEIVNSGLQGRHTSTQMGSGGVASATGTEDQSAVQPQGGSAYLGPGKLTVGNGVFPFAKNVHECACKSQQQQTQPHAFRSASIPLVHGAIRLLNDRPIESVSGNPVVTPNEALSIAGGGSSSGMLASPEVRQAVGESGDHNGSSNSSPVHAAVGDVFDHDNEPEQGVAAVEPTIHQPLLNINPPQGPLDISQRSDERQSLLGTELIDSVPVGSEVQQIPAVENDRSCQTTVESVNVHPMVTRNDAFEKQKLNAEFEGQGDESVESSTENLEVENEGEGEQSPRTDVAHLEARAVLSGKVLCQDEGVTNVTLNESERQLDLEGRSADIVAREKVADFAREDSEDPSAVIKGSESIPLVKAATSLDRTVDENSDFDSFPVEEDVRSLELGKHVAWADKVDRANSVNSASVLFPEMQDFHRRISKYTFMLDLQDKTISAKEKKRRDRAIKRNKRSGKENGILEVDGSSQQIQISLANRFLLVLQEKLWHLEKILE